MPSPAARLTREPYPSTVTQAAGRVADGLDAKGPLVAAAMVATYAVIRTLALPEPTLTAWLVAAIGLSLASPLCGLIILAAIGPFTEALTDDGRISAVPFLLAAVGTGLLLRLVLTRPLPRPNWPIVLALLLMAGTAFGVLNSYLAYGPDRGRLAAEMWVPGIGGAITVLIAGAWVAWRGTVAPLVVAIASTATAAVLTLVNLATSGHVRQSPLGWLLREEQAGDRLTGVIGAPNAAAVIFMLAFAGCVAVALLAQRRPWERLLLALVASSAFIAIWLTGSRSGVLGAAVVLTVITIAWNRRAGMVLGVLLIAAMVGLIATESVRDVPIASDASRVDAWLSTVRLWADNPITGAGFRSYEWLHANLGSPFINAPHNEWLRFFGEEGTLIGLGGVAFAVLTPVVLLRTQGWIAATSAAVAAGVFVAACFNNPFIYAQVNVPAFTIIGIGLGTALVERQPRASA